MILIDAFRDAFRTCFRRPADTLKLILTEASLTLICLSPLLLLTDSALKWGALAALPMWILIMFPARINAAAAMQNALGGGSLFCRELCSPLDYRKKVGFSLVRMLLLAVWASPLAAALVYAWHHYTGGVDAFTLLNMVKQFGGGDVVTGVKYLALILLGTVAVLMIGVAFHSGARHAYVLGDRKRVRGHWPILLCAWGLALVTMLPLWVSLGVIVERYRPLISELSGVVNGTTKIPSTRTTLLILAAGCALTVPLLPVRSLVTASVVRRLASRKEDAP